LFFPVLVVGVGNLLRRDDGAGPLAAQRLRTLLPPQVVVRTSQAEVATLLELLSSCQTAILIDAVVGIPPGQVRRLDGHVDTLPTGPSTSSHALTLAQILELGRALDQLPPSLFIYGVGGADFSDGEGLSPAVEAGVSEVVRWVHAELSEAAKDHSPVG
jgi:hydrogenase maturation protease